MKLTIAKLAALLLFFASALSSHGQTITYTSPNAGTDPTIPVTAMVHLNFQAVYQLKADLSGGIIGQVQSGGSISLQVFEYDPTQPQGVGSLLYKKFTQSSTTDYGGIAETFSVTGTNLNNLLIINTDNIKALGQKSHIYVSGAPVSCLPSGSTLLNTVMKEGFNTPTAQCQAIERNQPVIVKVTMTNAVASSVKIPGVGILNIPQGSALRPFATYSGPFGRVTIGSHRGKWEDVLTPENTQAAIKAALADNVDMIELDVWLSSDSVPIVYHDMGLNKRTTLTGPVANFSFSQLNGLPIRNRFDELISNPDTRLISLSAALDILQSDPKKTFINLDRSANSIAVFKRVYQLVSSKGMLDRCIFKGRFDPATQTESDPDLPTVANFRRAFAEMFPSSTPADRDIMIANMYYTPVLFDNATNSYDETTAAKFQQFMLEWINLGFADAFELNFKAYHAGSPAYAVDDDHHIVLLHQWSTLNNHNFVEWVHSYNIPVGIFAGEPEVAAVPQYGPGGVMDRDTTNLVSGVVFELPDQGYIGQVRDVAQYDFRGDPDFYVTAGADYVITDRPDQLLGYLRAINRATH